MIYLLTLIITFLVFLLLIKLLNGRNESSYQSLNSQNGELRFPEDVKHATFLLNEAYKKIENLEEKIMSLEGRMPKTYPDVRFLNYLNRKRILVCIPKRTNIKTYFFDLC